jgi:hypothetical protein
VRGTKHVPTSCMPAATSHPCPHKTTPLSSVSVLRKPASLWARASRFPSFFTLCHGRMEWHGGLQHQGKSVPGSNDSLTFSCLLILFSSAAPTLKLDSHLRMWVRCWPPVSTAVGSIRVGIFLLNDALPKAANLISGVRDATNSIRAWVCVARRPRSCVGGVRDAFPHAHGVLNLKHTRSSFKSKSDL